MIDTSPWSSCSRKSPWLDCSGHTISFTGPSVSPFRDFFDISILMCLFFHILYNCVNFVVQLWLEWRLPAVGRKVAATTSVANSATISARPVLFSFSLKGIIFVKQKSNTILSWYIHIIPVLHQNINIIYQTAAKIVLTVAVGIILHLFCPQPSKRCFLPRRSRCLL